MIPPISKDVEEKRKEKERDEKRNRIRRGGETIEEPRDAASRLQEFVHESNGSRYIISVLVWQPRCGTRLKKINNRV